MRVLFLLVLAVQTGWAAVQPVELAPEAPEGVHWRRRWGGELEIRVPEGQGRKTVVQLARLQTSPPGTRSYAIQGEVSCRDVGGVAYLELWNHFPGKGSAFSRTLAPSGPARGFSGSEDWRPFVLPFARDGSTLEPAFVELNLVFPQGGSISLRHVRLVTFESGVELATFLHSPIALEEPKAWWSSTQALWGGILWGGALILLLVYMGRFREGPLYGLMVAAGGSGGLLLLFGVVAFFVRQPSTVIFPLWGAGGLQILLALRLRQRLQRCQQMVKLQAALRGMGVLATPRKEESGDYPSR